MIKAKNIIHHYGQDIALDGVSLYINRGEFVSLVGESGSGKSTLLSILSTLLKPSGGEVVIDGKKIDEISNIDRFRREYIGFVFQFHYLIPYLSIYENVQLASISKNKDEIFLLLERLGIADIANKSADAISGGQRQRASIARAVINRPKILFADEPTGNLDMKNSQKVFEMLREFGNEGMTIVTATHDKELAKISDRVISLKDGQIE